MMAAAALAHLIAAAAAAAAAPAPAAGLWPLPASVKAAGDWVPIDAALFAFRATGAAAADPVLTAAFKRYRALICGDLSGGDGGLAAVDVSVADAAAPLAHGVDEAYNLSVSTAAASLRAGTVWGALRGLETLSQLATPPASAAPLRFAAADIADAPRFPHRGLLVDTAREYWPIDALEATVDAMASAKLNVLHWHVTDSQSFPLVIEQYPLLSEKGAFADGNSGCSGAERCVYTKQDIARLVEYARGRGVRVVPEIDTPGHAKSWGAGYPNATAAKSCPGVVKNADSVPLNAAEPFAAALVAGVLREMLGGAAPPFPDGMVHLGGDEVDFDCWTRDAGIAAYMAAHDLTPLQLEQQWVASVQKVAAGMGKTPVQWGDVLIVDGAARKGAALLPGTVVMAWRQQYELHVAAEAGYDTVLSAGWYLDSGSNKGWRDIYANEPFAPASNWTDPALRERVLGGEVSKWGCSGFCPFPTAPGAKWDGQVWPAAAVVAERLWSPASATDPDAALPRLQAMRDRLVARGVQAGSVS